MPVKYCKCEPGQSQYEDVDISVPVDARYVHARLEMDAGNRYIESLCLPLEKEDVESAYSEGIPEYNPSGAKTLIDKLLQIESLRNIRFWLPFHQEVEDYIYLALCQTYRSRRAVCVEDSRITYTAGNELHNSNNIMYGDSAKETNGGFALIGPPGSGKSATIGKAFSRQPQVVMQHDENGYHPQVTYLVVNCVSYQNFSSFYEGFGAELDKALGNVNPVYEAAIKRANGSGGKEKLIRRYIEIFSIGIIILDEIEFMSTGSNTSRSIEGILTMCNETDVSVAVVGTEDAYGKIFKNLRDSRRIGKEIYTGHYCNNEGVFRMMVNGLFAYQWFDEPIEVTDEIIDTLYELTHGIVDQLVTVYICIQMDYVTKTEKPKVDCDYFRRVVKRRYSGIQKILANMDMDALAKLNQDVKKENIALIDKQIQEVQAKRIEENAPKNEARRVKASNVLSKLRIVLNGRDESDRPDVEKILNKVMKAKDIDDLSEQDIMDRVFSEIYGEHDETKKTAKPKRGNTAKAKTIDKETVRDYVTNSNVKEAP